MKLLKNQLSFNSKIAIFLLNFTLFSLLMGVLINNDINKKNIIIILTITSFINYILIAFLINWSLKRNVFISYYLNYNVSGLDILNKISDEVKLPIQRLENNIFYSSYKHKRILNDIIIKEVTFILGDKKIYINIKNQNDSIFLHYEDSVEKKIKEIISKYSQKQLV